MSGFSQYGQQPEEARWRPAIIAIAVLIVAGALVWMLSRKGADGSAQPVISPYSPFLQVSDVHLSTAQNFIGGQVTYLQGKISNAGDKTVTGAEVETIFRNALGEIVDRQTQPLLVAAAPLGHADWVALRTAPLAPRQSASFRLSFEHISADWNRGFPELRFLQVATQ